MNRPALRYYGGKWRLAPWVISHMPPHMTYVEPFGGSAAVLLRKPQSYYEVYNDAGRQVYTFFKVVRENTDELIRQIELTPWSRDELALSYQVEDGLSDLEIARRFYVRCWQSFGHGRGGWRYQHSDNGYSIVEHWNRESNIYDLAKRFRLVQIENDLAVNVISRFDQPRTLFYVDPPYVHDTRFNPDGYEVEMNELEHEELLKLLLGVSGRVLLSGYKCDLYMDMLTGWEMISKKVSTNANSSRVECLWLSPSVMSVDSLPLFADLGVL